MWDEGLSTFNIVLPLSALVSDYACQGIKLHVSSSFIGNWIFLIKNSMLIRTNKQNISTYKHRQWSTGHPVRSGMLKPLIGRVVAESLTICEGLLLYVFFFLLYFHCVKLSSEMFCSCANFPQSLCSIPLGRDIFVWRGKSNTMVKWRGRKLH